jgi:steroid delta-isomerase-like uncharacterized protein
MKKYLFTLIAFSFLAGASCQNKIDNEKEMKALWTSDLEAWNGSDLSVLDEILSPNYLRHAVDISEDIIGIEAYKENITANRTSNPDFNVSVDELIIKGDIIVGRWTVTGTNTGPSTFGLPPTGNKIRISGAAIHHIVDGKISETWMFYNQAALLTQLNYTITPPEE